MFKNIDELLTFISITLIFVLALLYLIKTMFSIGKESVSLSRMYVYYFDNEDE